MSDLRPLPFPGEDRLSGQPNTISPASPAAPTTIRHHAKGVSPFPGEDRLSGQPNTISPASPAAPTTIRHHAKGV